MANKKTLPDEAKSLWQRWREFCAKMQVGYGFWALIFTLLFLAFVVTYDWRPNGNIVYAVGEVARDNIEADRNLQVYDVESTKKMRSTVRRTQALVCNLNTDPVDTLRQQMQNLITQANKAASSADMEKLRQGVYEEIGYEFTTSQITTLANPKLQKMIFEDILPWLAQRMREGVVADARSLIGFQGGVIIRNIKTGDETLLASTDSISTLSDVEQELSMHIRSLGITAQSKRLLSTLLGYYLSAPTLTPDYEGTEENANKAARQLKPVVHQVIQGEVIVRKGERINQEQLVILQALWQQQTVRFHWQSFCGILGVSLLLCTAVFFSPVKRKMNKVQQIELLFMAFLILLTIALALIITLVSKSVFLLDIAAYTHAATYAMPVAGLATLVALTLSTKQSYVLSFIISIICTFMFKGGLDLFIFYFFSGIIGARLIDGTHNRKDVVKAFLPLFAALLTIWICSTMLYGDNIMRLWPEFLCLLLGAFVSMIIIFAFSPLLEILFGFTTRFVLMELVNQEHPIMRQLMLDAPGTYHHSMIVATLAELAAKAIGANSLLCQVGAMYHDIGKIEKPEYFIENQFRGFNPHDRLTPTMSALVLISHVKRGIDLAQQHKLSPQIIDIIRQHHGTSFMRYFYHKSCTQLGEKNVLKEDFRYDGPRPQTREAALVMLADVIEASSRTLTEPTPSRIQTHVKKIIRNILAEGELDDVELTFKDIEQIADSFTLVLTGIFHKRIEYPGKVPLKPDASNFTATAANQEVQGQGFAASWLQTETGPQAAKPAPFVSTTGYASNGYTQNAMHQYARSNPSPGPARTQTHKKMRSLEKNKIISAKHRIKKSA